MDFRSSEPAYDLRVDNFQTGQHLANAREQAERRELDDVLIIDTDSRMEQSRT
jgi:hypothetical protein